MCCSTFSLSYLGMNIKSGSPRVTDLCHSLLAFSPFPKKTLTLALSTAASGEAQSVSKAKAEASSMSAHLMLQVAPARFLSCTRAPVCNVKSRPGATSACHVVFLCGVNGRWWASGRRVRGLLSSDPQTPLTSRAS